LRSGYFDRVGGDRFRTIGALHRGASQDRQDAARLIARLPIWTRTTAEERAKDRARDILDRYESALHAITLALSMRNILDGPTAVLCFEWAESLR
jgi:hypothetical protein